MRTKGIFKRILVPTDGSPPSVIAEQLGALVAERFSSEVTILNVASYELMRPELRETMAEIYDPSRLDAEFTREREHAYKDGKKSISEAAALFKQKGIIVKEKLIEHDNPAEIIMEEAEKGDYDLIIMGQSGRKEKEPHLGSMAEKVSQNARTPVLISREKSSVSKILVPIDGSENAEEALEYAVAIARKTDAKITLLYVMERSLFKPRSEETKKIGNFILAKAANKGEGKELHQKLEAGNPAKIITQMADKDNYDLIVMGSKGQGARMRFWLGSVSSHVIHYSNRSVLIVPTRKEEKGLIAGLSPERTIDRLVNLFVASRNTVSSYVKEKMGEDSLHNMFEYESDKFGKGLEKILWKADDIAKDMIRLNFQPLGMEARYGGNSEKATIVVTKCPLPEKSLQSVEFLKEFTFEQQDMRMDKLFASLDKISSSWEWPPKKTEVCATCRIVMPKLGEKLGFIWKHRVIPETPPKCAFDIEITKP